jgi:diguanylate cyclase (GGDEF)-like protein
VGAYSQQELINRAQNALGDMFPRAQVTLRIFPDKNQPNASDVWGQRSLQSSQAVLFTAKATPIPTLAMGKFIFVPLVVGGANIGWMGLDMNKDDEQFDIHDLRLAGISSNLVSLALHNADLYSQTQALATTDSLTGLHTRGYFDERFQEEFSKARRRGDNLAFFIMDVDHFKEINDNYGHYMGDEILRWVSRVLSAEVRETDLLARYGGDEFVILMPFTRAKEALDFGNRLHKKIASASFKWEKDKINLTISGGVSGIRKEFETIADMVHEADQALYKAKQNGRNQVAGL